MAKNTPDEKKPKRRTEVKELPQPKKELSKEEQKKVKGSAGAFFLVDIAANKPK